jgi:NAD(P)H-nitrite reductase large subunit
MKTAVIGASAAGGSLCETVRTLDPRAEITLITEEPLPLYSRCLLPLYVNGERTGKDLQFRRTTWAEELRLRVVHGRAIHIDPQGRTVQVSDGETVGYNRLAVTTGASPCQPTIPGIDTGGVFALYTLPGARAIKRWLPEAQKVIVLGAGLIGVKAAVALSEVGKTVVVIEQRTTVLPDTIDATAALMVTRLLTSRGVEVLTQETVIEVIEGPDRSINGVRLASGQIKACDLLVLAVGTQPNVDMLCSAGAVVNRGVLIDEYLHTSLPDVYAAGDAAEAPRIGLGGMLPQANWFNAKREGRLAAFNMLGQDVPVSGAPAG